MAEKVPLFSVIVVDFEGSVSRDQFRRKMKSLADQSDKDFEVLVYHDGPKSTPYEQDLAGAPFHPATRFFVTKQREDKWGHPNRDRGLRAAKGDWIIHTNADNLFYPNLIEVLGAAARDTSEHADAGKTVPVKPDGSVPLKKWRMAVESGSFARSLPQAFVYAIVMRGNVIYGGELARFPLELDASAVILSGVPVAPRYIDAMQFVMRRDLWLAEGGWRNHAAGSDGVLYQGFARKYHVRSVPAVLGEHW